MKYEPLYREQINDTLDLVGETDAHHIEFKTIRPPQALPWNHPSNLHHNLTGPGVPNSPEPENLPAT